MIKDKNETCATCDECVRNVWCKKLETLVLRSNWCEEHSDHQQRLKQLKQERK